MMTDDEIIAVVQARKARKRIQWRAHNGSGDWWFLAASAPWHFATADYRVKPEPREGWVHKDRLHELPWQEFAEDYIHVREIMPGE